MGYRPASPNPGSSHRFFLPLLALLLIGCGKKPVPGGERQPGSARPVETRAASRKSEDEASREPEDAASRAEVEDAARLSWTPWQEIEAEEAISEPTGTPAPKRVPLDFSDIDRAVERALKLKRMPGCVVVVGRGDGVRFEKAYGFRALYPKREPMTLDTIFDLASLTKPVATATSVMILLEQGRLRLDQKAASIVRELDTKYKRAITVRQLLVHTSGLPAVTPKQNYQAGLKRALRRIAGSRTSALPGGEYRYSDVGFIALGALVQRAAGLPLDAFVQKHILDPLEMKDTLYNPPEPLRARAAPTEQRDERWIRGVVHDPLAYRLGGVAGNAGLFSTARDLSRFARMMLGRGSLQGRRVLSRRAVELMTSPHFLGETVRALGWDMRSSYSANRAELFSPRAFGHGGFTGTCLWIDPDLDLFVLFLSNRVHPDGSGEVNHLAGAIGNIAVRVVQAERREAAPVRPGAVKNGIDVLRESGFEPLRGKSVGLVTNATGRARDGERTIDLLNEAKDVRLRALFSPEHGLESDREWTIADGQDRATGLRVYSLFGPTRRPTAAMLEGIDTLVFDIQDVGTRYFTYMSTLLEVIRAAAKHGVAVVVLDRPNPVDGLRVQGPLQDPEVKSFVNYHRLPVLHGMTAGELARLLDAELGLHADLQVVPLQNWKRELSFEQTGLTWINPSPNLRGPTAALLYPAVGLLESTNLSVGRGTDTPFELFGAPWLDHRALGAALNQAGLPGVTFVPVEFIPQRNPYRGARCHGLRLIVTDRRAFQPVRTGLEIARQILKLRSGRFAFQDLYKLLGHREAMRALAAGRTTGQLGKLWERDLQRFLERRRMFLLYE